MAEPEKIILKRLLYYAIARKTEIFIFLRISAWLITCNKVSTKAIEWINNVNINKQPYRVVHH